MLGGLIINKTAIAGNDANNFETGTGYRLNGGLNVAHKPSNPNRMVIYTYANDSAAGATKFQIACIADGSIAAREYDNGNWNDWSMTQSYLNAYPNLSSLASALGGVQSLGKTFQGNINDITTTSICRVKASAASGNLPAWVDWFSLITLVVEGLCGIQIACRSTQDIYFRLRWDNTWQATWYKLATS